MSTAVLPTPVVGYAPTRPVDVVPHLQQVARMGRTICSIWPAAQRAQRKHNGLTDYTLAAAPRGSYATLTVYDTQQWINIPNERSYRGNIEPRPIPAQIVAEDLVATWGKDTVGAKSGFKPGIGIIAGEVPTVEELASLRAGQSNLFNWLIKDAMDKHNGGEGINISDMHRMAAKEMLDKGANSLVWFPVVDFSAVKDCIACARQIQATAIRCEHCTTMLPEFYDKYGLDLNADPAVKAFMDRIKAGALAKSSKVEERDPRTAGQPKTPAA